MFLFENVRCCDIAEHCLDQHSNKSRLDKCGRLLVTPSLTLTPPVPSTFIRLLASRQRYQQSNIAFEGSQKDIQHQRSMLYVGNTRAYREQLARQAASTCDSNPCKADEREKQLLHGLAINKALPKTPPQESDGQLALTSDDDALCIVSDTTTGQKQAAHAGLRQTLKQSLLCFGMKP
jgi:hypothetical protein